MDMMLASHSTETATGLLLVQKESEASCDAVHTTIRFS